MIFRIREPFYYKRQRLARKFEWSRPTSEGHTGSHTDFARLGASERLQLRLRTPVRIEPQGHGFPSVRTVGADLH